MIRRQPGRVPSEARLQVAAAQFLRLALRPGTYWTSVDAGAGRMTPASAGLRKARGVKSGFSDVLILHAGRALAIELKSDKGRPSPAQVAFADEWEEAGGVYAVARSVEDVEEILRACGVPLAASVMARAA